MAAITIQAVPNESGGEVVVFGNRAGVVIMAATSLSASTAVPVTNWTGRGIMAFMNITSAFPGSASTTYALKVKVVDPTGIAGTYVTLGAASPRSTSGVSTVTIYPGIAVSAGNNCQVNMVCPRDLVIVASLSTGATSKEVVMSLGMTILR